jgi:hypothetical protein
MVPKLFEWQGHRFFFFSNEGYPLEPCHVHIRKGQATAKFWIVPEIRLASSYGFSARELNKLEVIVMDNGTLIREKWNEYFNI